jgi:RND family efflux transporter MFP subunit
LKKTYIYIIAALLLGIAIFATVRKLHPAGEASLLKAKAKKGKLEITVTTTGELQAVNSEDIKGPAGLRQTGLSQVKVSDLIPEGTVVKEGDYIASLDRSQLISKLKDMEADLSKNESQYTQTQLDTALEMRKLRDELVNFKSEKEEKELNVQQSKYESPSILRQAEIDLDRSGRAFDQASKNYKLKLQQNRAKMREVTATLNQQKAKVAQMTDLMAQFTIRAPKGGMLIYKKDWSGRKVKAGSDIYGWDPTVATLPDLSEMISRTYVNEIDISKVRVSQPVIVSVDAFPEKKFKGKITAISNIGEQLPNNETKVFEVTVTLADRDTLLRPAMTTSNIIITGELPEGTVYVPLDAIQGNDTLSYVFTDEGSHIIKQEIITGATTSEYAEVKAGLKGDEDIYLNTPVQAEKLKIKPLPADIKEKFKKKPQPASDAGKEASREISSPAMGGMRMIMKH